MSRTSRPVAAALRTGIIATMLLVASVLAAPLARAAAPPATVTSFQPSLGGVIDVELTAGQSAGSAPGWRMNLDVRLQNPTANTLTVTGATVSYTGGSSPTAVAFGATTLGRGLIPEVLDADGNVDVPANEIPPMTSATARLPEDRVHALPVADSVTVALTFDGFTEPLVFTAPLTSYANASEQGSYAFAGAASTLPAGMFWHNGSAHTYRSHHRLASNQRFAEDWGIVRWTGSGWSGLVDNGDATKNQDYLIWGQPLHAVADGTVVRCANGYADNATANGIPQATKDAVADGSMPPGGNHIWIQHVTGERLLYAHFMGGTLRADLCPADPSLGEHEVVGGATVRAGEYLGLVGNSGNSSAPHLHIHSDRSGQGIPLLYHNIGSVEDDLHNPANDPNPPLYPVDDEAVGSHQWDPGVGVLVRPGPRANVVATTQTTPAPAVAGEQVTIAVDVRNYGPEAASGVVVTTELPAGFTYAGDTGGCSGGGTTVTCALGQMAAPAPPTTTTSTAYTITATIDPALVHDNGGPVAATITTDTASTPLDDSAAPSEEEVTVVAVADLSVQAIALDLPSDVLIGEDATGTATISVSSDGPSSPMDAVLGLTDLSVGGATLTLTPSSPAVPALADGEVRDVVVDVTVSCTGAGSQDVAIQAAIAPASAHDTDPDGSDDTLATPTQPVECVVPVQVNIKPGSTVNPLKPDTGQAPLAVLSTDVGEYGLPVAVDATTIDPLSVRFGPADVVFDQSGGSPERHGRGHPEDSLEMDEVTRDGDLDMVLHHQTAGSGLDGADQEACVRGLLEVGGQQVSFFGCDTVWMH